METENSQGEFLSKLTVEVEAWRRRGLISAQQGSAILGYYNLRSTAGRAFRLGPAATLVSIVGSIVLGVGVLIFFGAYWLVLPAWSKVVLVIASTGTAYAAGYWLQFRWRVMPRVGASLLLLGSILFQAGLFLLAQTFGKPVDSPILLLVGTAGVLPLAYFTGSRPLVVFGLLDGLAWLGWTLAQHYPNPPESFGLPLIYILAGVLIYALGRFHTLLDHRRHFEPIYQVLGLATILVPMYVLTFGSFWDAAREQHLASVHVPLWFGAAVLLAGAGAASLLLARPGDMSARVEAGVFAVIALVAGFVAYVPAWAGEYALLFNGLFLGLAVLACVRGYLEGEVRFVNAGVAFLALGLITRYSDTFWPVLPQSIFFMTGGLVLLSVAGGLEIVRRRLLSGIRQAGLGEVGASLS